MADMTRRAMVGTGLASLAALALPACARSEPRSGITGAATRSLSLAPHEALRLPAPVQEIYPVLHRGRVHLAGGLMAEGGRITGAADTHLSFNPVAPGQGWRAEAPLPVPLHHPQLVSWQGSLWALGGFRVEGPDAVWVMEARCWRLDSDAWTRGPDLPRPAGEAVSAVLGGALHLCGGRAPSGSANAAWSDHKDRAEHFVLALPDAEAWTRAAPLPAARNSSASAVLNGRWHVISGRTVEGGTSAKHHVYNPIGRLWSAAAPLPEPAGGLAAAVLDGRLIAGGGEWFAGQAGKGGEAGVETALRAYDTDTDSWSDPLARLDPPRHGHGMVAGAGRLWLIGGAAQARAMRRSI